VASASSLLLDETTSPNRSNASPAGKTPRKQRSFHHPRIPLPTLPTLRHASSYNNSTSNTDTPGLPKATSTTANSPQQTRRRLFSGPGGRRASISKSSSTPPASADDDLRSLFSLNLSIDGGDSASRESAAATARGKPVIVSFANMGNQLPLVTDNACISPTWEEMGMGNTSKRYSHVDYVPQHIMSPADMLKLEQQFTGESSKSEREQGMRPEQGDSELQGRKPKLDIEPGDFGLSFISGGRSRSIRSRTDSLLSNMSAFGSGENRGGDEMSIRGLVGVAQTFGTPVKRPSTANDSRSVLWGASPVKSNVSPSSTRPSTALPLLASPPTSLVSLASDTATGLPPPPRPRVSREKQHESSKRSSVAPLQPLSPPPRRRPTKPVVSQEGEESSIPSPQSSRPPSAFGQKAFGRRSIAKKPSFLDIEDEWDPDTVSLADMSISSFAASYSIEERESSFLDLDRGTSFDTVRSFDDDIRRF